MSMMYRVVPNELYCYAKQQSACGDCGATGCVWRGRALHIVPAADVQTAIAAGVGEHARQQPQTQVS